MKDTLLIVFVKNIILGKVKTRLAKTIGTQGAFEVYKHIVEITELETSKMKSDTRIYFSDVVIEEKWSDSEKFVQKGKDLGERMKNAFIDGFSDGYKRIILIGSDLPDITSEIINEGLDQLKNKEVVFGPAEDGGYYLIGLTNVVHSIFEDKPWSTSSLLKLTLEELEKQNRSYHLLQKMNDIDTIEDLKKSTIYKEFINIVGE